MIRELFAAELDTNKQDTMRELIAVINNPSSHPAEIAIAKESLASLQGSLQHQASICRHEVPKYKDVLKRFSEGDYTYTVVKAKPELEIMRDPFFIIHEGERIKSIHDDKIKMGVQIMVIVQHKNGSTSVRRLSRRQGQYVYSDLRDGGLGSGISRSQFVASLPKSKIASDIVDFMESELPIGPVATSHDGYADMINAISESISKCLAALNQAPVSSK